MRFLIVGLSCAAVLVFSPGVFAQERRPPMPVVVMENQEFTADGRKHNIPRGAIVPVVRDRGETIETAWLGHSVSIDKRATVPLDQSIAFFTSELRRKPSVYDYHVRGKLYSALGKPREALADFSEAIRREPKTAVLYFDRANELLRLGQADAALADLNKALQIEAHPDVYVARAQVWATQGEMKKCIADLDEAIRRDAKFVNAYVMRAEAFYGLGEYRRTLRDLDAAAKLDARHPDVGPLRGATLNMLGEFTEARDAFLASMKQYPNYPGASNAYAWFLATCPEAKYRNGRQAVELATKACKTAEFKNAVFLDTLAAAYAEAGDFGKAVEYQQKAIDLPTLPLLKQAHRRRLASYQARRPYRDRP